MPRLLTLTCLVVVALGYTCSASDARTYGHVNEQGAIHENRPTADVSGSSSHSQGRTLGVIHVPKLPQSHTSGLSEEHFLPGADVTKGRKIDAPVNAVGTSNVRTEYTKPEHFPDPGNDYQWSTHVLNVISNVAPGHRSKRTIIGRYPLCPRGCTSCSAINGCVACERRFYLLLYRRHMRQIGVCTPACPVGYYGVRRRPYNRCFKCQANHCQSCFSRHYCTHCYPPYISHRGSCLDACPLGTHFANYSSECHETVDCIVGPWTEWGACRPRARGCGQNRGVRIRTRNILEDPFPIGTVCPTLEVRRGCQLTKPSCRDNCRRRKRNKRKRKWARRRKWRKTNTRGRGRLKKHRKLRRCRNNTETSQRCRRRRRHRRRQCRRTLT